MSIFKELEKKDIINRKKEDRVINLFDNNETLLAKTSGGWNYTKNYSYVDDPLVTGSVYFVENNSFCVAYGSGSVDNEDQYLNYNSIMSSVGADWNYDDGQYDYVIDGSRMTEVVAISFSPNRYEDAVDNDNFYITLSGSTGNEYTGISGNNYDVAESLVLAPYYVKDSANISGSSVTPAYELRTTDNSSFLSYDVSSKAININWTSGTLGGVMGVIYPDIGLILLFPQLFGTRSNLLSAIQSGDRSLNSLNSIMDIGGYAIKRVEKTIVFSRLYSTEGNFTTNPTAFLKNGFGGFKYRPTLDDPKSFISRVGFYNKQNECLAIANISNAVEKNNISEKSFKIEIEN